MAKLNYKTRLSRLKKGNRPCYQAWVAHNGTIPKDDIVRSVAQRSGLSEAMAEMPCRVSLGAVTFEPAISGSLPSMDAQLGDENEVYVAVRLSDALRNAAAGVSPVRVSEDALGIRLDNVQDESASANGRGTITGTKTQGDEDDHINVSGGTLDVTGENLETATAIELLNDSGELWQTVEATYADGKLTAELEFEDRPSATGAVRVTTAGGSATHNVSYSSH